MIEPGRELDVLVAEKVMGWRAHTIWGTDYEVGSGEPVRRICYAPYYSTDIAAAWDVVQKMREDRRKVLVHWENGQTSAYNEEFWEVEISGPLRLDAAFRAHADTAPHAICIAALRAVGVEVDDG